MVLSTIRVSHAPKLFKPAVHKRLNTSAMKIKDEVLAHRNRFKTNLNPASL